MLLLGAMVLGWLGLLATDAHLFQSPSLSQTQADPADPELAALDAADGKPAKVNPNDMALNQSNDDLRNDLNNGMPGEGKPGEAVAAITDGSEAAVEPLGTGKPAVSSIDTSDVSPPEIGSAETVASIDSPPMKTDTSSPTDSADASTSGTDSESTDPVDVTPAKTVAAQSARIDLVDQYGMVVLEDRDNGKWMWAVTPEFSSLNISDKRLSKCYAAIAEPFDARLNSPEQGWSALVPGSSMFETVANEQSGVRLLSGRLIVEHVAAAADPIRFKLFAGSQSVDIELPTARSYAAIRLVPGNVESSEADAPEYNVFPEPRNSALTIYAVGGDVMVNIDAQTEPLKIARGSHLVLSVDSGDAPVLHDMPVAPNWVFDAVQPKAESTMSLIKLTASEFRKSLTVADAGTEVMENLNPEIAAYGVKLPALLRNVDDLASALLDSQLTTVRTEAIHGLQAVNRQNVGGRTRIIESLQTRLPEAELDNVMKLIGGISQTAAEDRATSSWLVSMLNNNRPAVRELAIFNLENLTGERNNFIVDDDSNRRDIAVRRWTKLLERNDGRLVSPPN